VLVFDLHGARRRMSKACCCQKKAGKEMHWYSFNPKSLSLAVLSNRCSIYNTMVAKNWAFNNWCNLQRHTAPWRGQTGRGPCPSEKETWWISCVDLKKWVALFRKTRPSDTTGVVYCLLSIRYIHIHILGLPLRPRLRYGADCDGDYNCDCRLIIPIKNKIRHNNRHRHPRPQLE
jgi:hypothetical protein